MATLRDHLLDVDADDAISDKRIKPSLLALIHDQAELLTPESDDEYGLREGFPDSRALIEWYQRATVRTLGYIADEWPPESCVADGVLVASTVRGQAYGAVDMSDEKAKRYRQVLEAVSVQSAFVDAYRDLRRSAREYVQRPGEQDAAPTGQDLSPSEQAYLAMRPGFQVIDRQQQRALADVWGGFEDADALADWAHGLNSPTNGEIEPEFAEMLLTDGVAMDLLVYNPDQDRARLYREVFAATVLLPAFVAGVRSIDTDELAKTTSDTPTTLRMKGGQ